MQFSPKQLLQFDSFMRQNFDAAKEIKTTPVLFIQGVNDKLINPRAHGSLEQLERPRGSSFLVRLESICFRGNQFSPEDLSFVRTWIITMLHT